MNLESRLAIVALFVCLQFPTDNRCHAVLEDHKYWYSLNADEIQRALGYKQNTGRARNVIVFVGDGLGPTTVTAARIYGKSERGKLVFEEFPNIGALKTYSADKIVPDSASTATALFSGVKTNQKTVGVDASVTVNDCDASLRPQARLGGIMRWGQAAGKATGFVTNTRVTHATPSALYAHVANRKWECEATMPQNASNCKDIAKQLFEESPGKSINVILGGGRQCLQSKVSNSSRDPIDTWACYSKDGRDLIAEWVRQKELMGVSHAHVDTTSELMALTDEKFVLGIFANGHLKMENERDTGPGGMPSLTNMTEAAIKTLRQSRNGYILVVEGGMIDFAHHRGHARQALHETIAFNDAIEKAVEMTKPESEETLIIVTSDHSHSLVLSGYATRGTAITGIAQNSRTDDVPYTSLLYGTGGPDNYKYSVINGSVVREDPSTVDTNNFSYAQQAAVLTNEVTHGGTDVLVYATGPMAHLFHTVHEQTYVAYVIGYAAKIGPYDESRASDQWRSTRGKSFVFALIVLNFILCAHRLQF